MAKGTVPSALLSHLHRADGSATFSQNGYTVIGAVNGPIEVQRRDELPEEAAVDVVVRPAAGVGGMFLNDVSLFLPPLVFLRTLMWCFRYTGEAPRIDPTIYAAPNHPHP
jgi:hypothetical protein